MKSSVSTRYLSLISKPFTFIILLCVIYLIAYHPTLYTSYFQYNINTSYSCNYPNQISLPKRTLILYVYGNTHSSAEGNLLFFIRTAVRQHHHADYYIILQQINNVPFNLKQLPSLPSNAHYIQHENKCFDLGTVGWFLSNNFTNITKYTYFIFLNASIRGPFIVSYYPNETWYNIFTNRLNQDIKLVGPTINCEVTPHVQSYLWALDFPTLTILLNSSKVFSCHKSMRDAVYNGEIVASRVLLGLGYGIGSLMKKYENIDFRLQGDKKCSVSGNPNYWPVNGIFLDPFEVVFAKLKGDTTRFVRQRVQAYEQWFNTLN